MYNPVQIFKMVSYYKMCQGLIWRDSAKPGMNCSTLNQNRTRSFNVFTEIISAADVDLFLQIPVTSHLYLVLGPRVLRK